MKKIFLICLSAAFTSTGFAQSSVADVPENKIKPAYETAPAAKPQAVTNTQKAAATQPAAQQAPPRSITTQQQPAPVVAAKTVETPVEPTAPSRLQGIKATSADQPALTGQQPAASTAVDDKKPAVTKQGGN